MELEAEVTKQEFRRFNTIALKRITEKRKFKIKLTTFNILYWVPLGTSGYLWVPLGTSGDRCRSSLLVL